MLTWTGAALVPQSLHALQQFVFLAAALVVDTIQHQDLLQLFDGQLVQFGAVDKTELNVVL